MEIRRPDLLARGQEKLSKVERAQIRVIRRSFEPGLVDQTLRWCQRHVGSRWITACTDNLRRVHHLDRWPKLDPRQSYICVSNHRSFFDLYVITGHLVKHDLVPHRIIFPVRAKFFYDQPLGFVVNGAMSFFAMYPPIFRERARAALNLLALDELTWLLRRGGMFAGIHPEGTRNKGSDPYSFLPAQSGVGRVIHGARVPVLPVFINGLLQKDLKRQVGSNFDGTGREIILVFGEPVDFGGLLEERGSPRAYSQIAARAMEVIGRLGVEEKEIRSRMERGDPPRAL